MLGFIKTRLANPARLDNIISNMFLKSTKDWKHAGRMFQLSVFFDINKYSCCNLPRYVIFFRLTLDKLFFYFKHKNTYEFLTGGLIWHIS